MNSKNEAPCPLCQAGNPKTFFRDRLRVYLKCPECYLIFVPGRFHLGKHEEKERYDLHRNSPEDNNYRRFLSKLFLPMVPLLKQGGRGLDFGSGPGPTLSKMFIEAGFTMVIFDVFYAPDGEVLQETYDFLTCSETVEHFRNPRREWKLMAKLVRKGGVIGIMTKILVDDEIFSQWYYKNDPTHICFYSQKTFNWISEWLGIPCRILGDSVVLFSVPYHS